MTNYAAQDFYLYCPKKYIGFTFNEFGEYFWLPGI